ncbi:MAG TPA: sugar ABC transporter ATP-binding protein [Desulfosporosinus sp.]|nr:sugar ABC transporter ATP-binding protein [Desulfosporosinus sp.]
MNDTVIDIAHVSKRFGSTFALKDVSVSIKRGTVHALVGKNGAGKTTLVSAIAGIIQQDTGSVSFDGQDIGNLSLFERQRLGIRIATQHASVVPHLSVAENVFLGTLPKNRYGFVDWKEVFRVARKELMEYGLDVDPRVEVRKLSMVDQRKVNIVRALFGGTKVVILDEPTTALSAEERDSLFGFVTRLSQQGTTFILISHYLEEVVKMSDEITVLRDGEAFSGYFKGHIDEEKLANLIADETVQLHHRKIRKAIDTEEKPIVSCNNVSGSNMNGSSFSIFPGEIVGFVGFPGSGAREICRAMYGLLPFNGGNIEINGKTFKKLTPTKALRQGIGYIPYDRHAEGLIGLLSIKANVGLPLLDKGKWGFVNSALETQTAQKYLKELKIKANSIEDKASSLSGGNQQKVVLAKILGNEPKILILDEPTVGIDIQSREEILLNVDGLTNSGVSVLYLTNDYGELLRVADRLLFFADGRMVREEINEGLNVEEVIRMRDSVRSGIA